VACGTGQSAVALTEIAQTVIATDISQAMLAQAPAHPQIRYFEAPAEDLPVEDESVDLVTVTLAFHWLDHRRFLAEAHRVMRPDGTLVVTHHGYRSWLLKNAALRKWFKDEFFARYPIPPRNDQPLTDDTAREWGFAFLGREQFSHEVSLSPEELARNLVTHSNVIAAVEEGRESLDAIVAWIVESVRPCYSGATENIVYGGEIWYLQRSPIPAAPADGSP